MTVSSPSRTSRAMAAARWALKNWWLLAFGVIGVLVVLSVFLRPDGPGNPTEPSLEQVWNACGRHGQLTDGGRTLVLDMQGRDDVAGVRAEEVACTLHRLNAPAFVVEKMDGTRAVDGRQDETWDSGGHTFEASWTYHPDNGLDILIREL